MKILTVIPIVKGIPRDELSYFSARDAAVGTVVTAPLGSRQIRAVVIDADDVRDMKSQIKSSAFKLRNVSEVQTDGGLPFAVFEAARKTARFFAQRSGSVIRTMLPDALLDAYVKRTVGGKTEKDRKLADHPRTRDIQAIQIPRAERYSYYKTMIRENLARHGSTMIVVPTSAHLDRLKQFLSPGIEERIITAHGRMTKKAITSSIDMIFDSKDPIVAIVTAPFASIIRKDWNAIIIESAGNQSYRYPFKPHFDMCMMIEEVSHGIETRLVYADSILPLDVRMRMMNREILDIRSTWHIAKPRRFDIENMGKEELGEMVTETGERIIKRSAAMAQKANGAFQMIGPQTAALVEYAMGQKSQVLLVAGRKGLAPLTVCSDCNTAVACPICGTPLVLHKKTAGSLSDTSRIYVCHHCSHTTIPIDRCSNCGSWNLTMLGISTEGVAEECRTRFPASPLLVADGDTTTTPASVQKTIKTWLETPCGILVATPMILSYLDSVPFGAIISIDSLLSLPTHTSGEESLRVVVEFLETITEAATLETRSPQNPVVSAVANDQIFEYIGSELASRRDFGYPPSKVLIKISIEVAQNDTHDATRYFETVFEKLDPDIIMRRARVSDRSIIRCIIKLDPKDWQGESDSLHDSIKELGPDFEIEINPDSAL